MTKVLCIGDAHVEPGYDVRTRFLQLSKYIVETKPDVIVQMGDFLSMSALSHWDRNKRLLMEGRRYTDDLSCGKYAIKKLFSHINVWNAACPKTKKKRYTPKLVWLDGNHEEWLPKYLENHPELKGMFDIKRDLGLYELEQTYEVEYVDYGKWAMIDGIAFTHAPITGNGRPVSGETATKSSLNLFDTSVVFAHTHRLEFQSTNRHGRTALQQALSVGCFFEHDFDYCKIANNKFWRGVVMLETHGDGTFDYETVSLAALNKRYG